MSIREITYLDIDMNPIGRPVFHAEALGTGGVLLIDRMLALESELASPSCPSLYVMSYPQVNPYGPFVPDSVVYSLSQFQDPLTGIIVFVPVKEDEPWEAFVQDTVMASRDVCLEDLPALKPKFGSFVNAPDRHGKIVELGL